MQPLNLLCLIGIIGFFARFRYPKCGQKIINLTLIAIIAFGIIPLGPLLITLLERQYPASSAMPSQIDGIIVLGGAFEPAMSRKMGQLSVNDSIERFLCFVDLGKKNPSAMMISSGGNGDILNPDVLESDDAKAFFALTTLNNRDIVYEDKSKNTYENALYSKEIAKPNKGENWVVITSAYHMPRAVGIFQKLDWDIIPYPCDFKTSGDYKIFNNLPNIAMNFSYLNIAIKEIFGMIVYYLTGKSAFIFPPSKVASQP